MSVSVSDSENSATEAVDVQHGHSRFGSPASSCSPEERKVLTARFINRLLSEAAVLEEAVAAAHSAGVSLSRCGEAKNPLKGVDFCRRCVTHVDTQSGAWVQNGRPLHV